MVRLFLCVLCSLFLFVQNASCEILHAQKYRNWTSFLLTEQPGYAAMSTTAADGSTLVLLLSGQDGIVRILSPSISQKKAAAFDYNESTRVRGTVRIDAKQRHEVTFNIRRIEQNRIALEIEGSANEYFLQEAMAGNTIRLRVNASNSLKLRLSYSLNGFTYACKRCMQLLASEDNTPGDQYFDEPGQDDGSFNRNMPSGDPGEILSL